MAENGAFALLERRDIDNLGENVRTLNRTMTLIHETMQKQLAATLMLNELLRGERDHRELTTKADKTSAEIAKAIPIATAKPARRRSPR